ncbi:hypothetical protein [Bradyrhizobium sp. 170]|uniref:hypothetical protein n=1 Tax=Bradyrhizobium sp. 170 TaxID=2782641 RepID=UPI0020002386|nr:hypothetical protein [Bradyrhizobium sp. 170]UPK03081.1 hypothetical protein IVB05_36985 [Bradyrhizobium sp. 170]
MIDDGFTCQDCGGFIFRAGPCGGLSQNIECAGCGQRFNVSRWRGMLVTFARIPNDSEWREDMFPKVLQ